MNERQSISHGRLFTHHPDGTVTWERIAPAVVEPGDPPAMHLRGLGDVVSAVTKAVGIRECGGCAKRREALNKLVPFNGGEPPAPTEPTSDSANGTAPAD